MRLAPATPLADLSEKEWQAQVIELARTLGWHHYFTYRSKRSPAGFPDLVLWRDRLVIAELKGERGKPSDLQKVCLAGLLAAGQEVYLIRPRHLEALASVLAARSPFDGARFDEYRTATEYLRGELRREIGEVSAI